MHILLGVKSNTEYLKSNHYVPGTVPNALRMISFNYHNHPIRGHYYYPCFKDEEIKAQRGQVIRPLATDEARIQTQAVWTSIWRS